MTAGNGADEPISPPEPPESNNGSMAPVGQALSLGAELVVPTLFGWWMDGLFVSAPVGILIGGVFGFTLVVIHAFRMTPKEPPSRRPPSESSRP